MKPYALFCALLVAGALPAKAPDWFQPLWRSAILPGWGQAYNGQNGKAYAVGAANMALLVGEVGSFLVGDSARQQYLGLKDPGSDFDGLYGTWESMAAVNHACFWGMSAAYAFNLVDAVMSSGQPRPTAARQGLELSLVPGGFRARLHAVEF